MAALWRKNGGFYEAERMQKVIKQKTAILSGKFQFYRRISLGKTKSKKAIPGTKASVQFIQRVTAATGSFIILRGSIAVHVHGTTHHTHTHTHYDDPTL